MNGLGEDTHVRVQRVTSKQRFGEDKMTGSDSGLANEVM